MTITKAALGGDIEVGKRLIINLDVTNSGRSPALDFRVTGGVFIRREITQVMLESITTVNTPGTRGVIGPNTTFVVSIDSPRNLTNEEAAHLHDGWLLLALGTVSYTDIFGIEHHTRFCFHTEERYLVQEINVLLASEHGNTAD